MSTKRFIELNGKDCAIIFREDNSVNFLSPNTDSIQDPHEIVASYVFMLLHMRDDDLLKLLESKFTDKEYVAQVLEVLEAESEGVGKGGIA